MDGKSRRQPGGRKGERIAGRICGYQRQVHRRSAHRCLISRIGERGRFGTALPEIEKTIRQHIIDLIDVA